MGTNSIVDSGLIGKEIAYSINASFLHKKNGFIIEKRNNKSNIYIRICLVHNYVSELTDLSIERGSLYDKKPYVKEIFKDVENLNTALPESIRIFRIMGLHFFIPTVIDFL